MSRVKMRLGASHYIFGFVDITEVPEDEIFTYRGKGELPSPLLEVYEGDEVELILTNLGLPQRPDLDDTHTIHWHGFANQIPLWDGVPEASMSVPVGRNFTYFYEPRDPGTYMYHCHFEPVEHIQMGMVGPVIVRPDLEKQPGYQEQKLAYNHPDTAFDREYLVFLTDLDTRPHDLVANAQEFDWTDYRPDYWLLNGRSYPDTLKPDNDTSLPLQPFSGLIEAHPGDRVLLRIINLGFEQQCMEILGIVPTVVALDARELRNPQGQEFYREEAVISIAAGQTVDAIFVAPSPGTYPLYNRCFHKQVLAWPSGGMVSEVRVYPRGWPIREGR